MRLHSWLKSSLCPPSMDTSPVPAQGWMGQSCFLVKRSRIKINLVRGEVVEIRVLFNFNLFCRHLGDSVPSRVSVVELRSMGELQGDVERRKGSSLPDQCHCPPPLKKEGQMSCEI